MRMIYINSGGKVGDLEVVPHAIVDKGITLFDMDTGLKLMEIIQNGGFIDWDGGIEDVKEGCEGGLY
jgi:hypothetical protein